MYQVYYVVISLADQTELNRSLAKLNLYVNYIRKPLQPLRYCISTLLFIFALMKVSSVTLIM